MSQGDKIKVVTWCGKDYHLTLDRINGNEIYGIDNKRRARREIILNFEDIKTIQFQKIDSKKTISTFVMIGVVILFLQPWDFHVLGNDWWAK